MNDNLIGSPIRLGDPVKAYGKTDAVKINGRARATRADKANRAYMAGCAMRDALKRPWAFAGSLVACAGWLLVSTATLTQTGCRTTTTTAGPGGTNVVTTVKGIDAATLASIDAALAQAASNAPAVAASIIAVQNAIHGAPTVVTVSTNK